MMAAAMWRMVADRPLWTVIALLIAALLLSRCDAQRYRALAAARATELAEMKAAQATAHAEQVRINAAAERRTTQLAQEVDRAHLAEQAASVDAAAVYIAAHRAGRMQSNAGCPSGGAGAAADDHRPGDADPAGGAPQLDAAAHGQQPRTLIDPVMVEANDIHVCTRNTLRAEAARDWALALSAPADAGAGDTAR